MGRAGFFPARAEPSQKALLIKPARAEPSQNAFLNISAQAKSSQENIGSSRAEPKNFLKIFMTQLEHEIFLSFMRKILNFFLQNLQKIFYFSKNFWLILARRADEL